jgi:hypothetical protein
MLGCRDERIGLAPLRRLGRSGRECDGLLKQQAEEPDANDGAGEVHHVAPVDRVKRCVQKIREVSARNET